LKCNKIISREQAAVKISEAKTAGKTVVFTNGCFDILHVGHVRYLQRAREMGDVLVVGVNTDQSVRRLKGIGRPVNTETDRAEVLAALGCVDYVVLFDEDTPVELIETIKPDVDVKGGDYSIEKMPEAEIMKAFGGRVEIIPYETTNTHQYSTTQTIDSMKKRP
jgi:rfaE bifunctional protein nucleotidyltransferase chain/domain